MTMPETGTFTLSLDTELAWGSFDHGGLDKYETAYLQTPSVVERLCTLLEKYDLAATWAVVGHLLEDCDGEHDGATARQQEWLSAAPCSTDVDPAVWHLPDLFDRVQSSRVNHDIGLHGYSHLPLAGVDRDTAVSEVRMACDAALSAGLDPVSFVFPRNRIGHTDVLTEHGLEVYRDRDARWYERRAVPSTLRKPLRWLDEAAALTPHTAVPTYRDNLVALPGSHPFRPTHGPWRWTPPGSQQRRGLKGLDRAADSGRVYHLWLHPFNLARDPEPLFEAMEAIFQRVAALREANRITVRTMAAYARENIPGIPSTEGSNDLSATAAESRDTPQRIP